MFRCLARPLLGLASLPVRACVAPLRTPLPNAAHSSLRQLSSMSGVCFSPFPRNELEILRFNLRQQLKRRSEDVKRHTEAIISDATGSGEKPLTLESARAALEARLQRPASQKEARSCHEACMAAFDPLMFQRHVAAERERVDTAVEEACGELRRRVAAASARGDRLTVTRNECGALLEPFLGRYPDAEEVDVLWTLQYLFPLVTWEEGGEYSRDARDAAVANAIGQNGNDCM